MHGGRASQNSRPVSAITSRETIPPAEQLGSAIVMDAAIQPADVCLATVVQGWVAAVRLFWSVDRVILDCAPSAWQAERHERFLAELITLGRLIETWAQAIDDVDARVKFSALITYLETTLQERKEIL
jgi:hypothetical protein